MDYTINIPKYIEKIKSIDTITAMGKVNYIVGLLIGSDGPGVSVGEICFIENNNKEKIRAEVVGFKENKVLLMPLGDMKGVAPGSNVLATGKPFKVAVSNHILGRVLDGLGNPLDGKGIVKASSYYEVSKQPPNPLLRRRINQPLAVGVRAVDGLMTIGKGQRIGIFAGSGVGKSTLLGMMARNTEADVNVIALIGERGREVRDFIEKDLGEDGLRRSVVIVATSDQPALIRIKGAFVATAIAEYFRDQGKNVLLMMDSITRFCMAQREVGLTIGEPPATKGYTPSVFAMLPKLLERAGTSDCGTITGLYTVLVDADDMNEPIADASRSILDGHIVLSRKIAAMNHYPAIDVLESLSRLMVEVTSDEQQRIAGGLRDIMSTYNEAQDLINIGAYIKGSNPKIDYAITKIDSINSFLKQKVTEKVTFQDVVGQLIKIFAN
ncbi:MAG: EscN/YscN/HrcN family type III secretion system ATPase [Candidatus Margulisiibacteriota bacterium]|nr:MAG: EscN/YscN/HrcN family type III secretion system ATPase [Candidatus Margulisbacteria bacterium GWD2_39_127]OGI05189.1 MAG: EscN/YscN/HrcN family type III secretion system ATPase [Candidatus Margulisbacteria bacterium GWF2_38_17]OGI06238.1 MAG: EscN/YscN/HrcN family type III secretion system ATPase [Candidatus Margulisbacteria bacterium GWE2_39_32]PZM78895.1 MAG: EscN/YscN/HrcN family type III secretion system ATPase [Candidatus Margulisiibacteriota bacterium]HAR64523.1 EscN/YscN/HrcN fam